MSLEEQRYLLVDVFLLMNNCSMFYAAGYSCFMNNLQHHATE